MSVEMSRIKTYLKKIYDSRFFWAFLASIELKNKFRRSKLGILWTFLMPLGLTLIMSVIFGVAFHQNVVTFAPYVLSGVLTWDIFTQSFVGASAVIIMNEPFIKQFNHPISIYSLKSAVVITTSFILSMISLILWQGIATPSYLPVALLSLPTTILFIFCISWSGVTISSYTNTKFRDYPQMMSLVMQGLWYVSPVFLQERLFTGNKYLSLWFSVNPITHILNLVRRPFLEGLFPSSADYLVSIIFTLVLGLWAIRIDYKNSKDIVFYI